MPRVTKRQINRANVDAANPEEYFRRTIYIPMLDALISDMISRFGKQHEIAVGLSLLVPKQVVQCDDFKPLEDSTRFYAKIISDFNIDLTLKLLKAEVSKWRLQWQKCKLTPPTTAIDSYSNCDVSFYPLIKQLLQILCTLPVSVATAERSFSTLRRLKTWTRSTMGEERLFGLALMHVHRDIDISLDNVIDRFVKSHATRLDFVI